MSDGDIVLDKIAYPEWTDISEKNGLDPLGMQNSSVNIYQTFLPGISNVTLRMRYYGFYAWLCRTYIQIDGSEDPERWKRFVRRGEALYALVAHRNGGESGVAGVQWAEKAHNNSESETIDFSSAADPDSDTKYLQQSWGAYGAAYGSQLFEIDIFWESPDHSIPVPSDTCGDRLATVFAEALGDIALLFAEILERGTVTRDQLVLLAPMIPSEIKFTGEERALYQEILFVPQSSEDFNGQSRRLSLLLILKVAELIGREPTSEEVRWILYAGQDQNGHDLELNSTELEEQRQRWWVYHANDLCHVAMETLLKFALDTLGKYPAGIRPERLAPLCVDRILEDVEKVPDSWSDLVKTLQLIANPNSSDNVMGERILSQNIVKRAGRSDKVECEPEVAWNAIILLAALIKRCVQEDHPIESELKIFNPETFQTLLTEKRFLTQNEDAPLRETLAHLIEKRVIRRHLWVAARKFQHGDYTFLIEPDEGLLRLRDRDGPVFTNPRLGSAIAFLKDIHLIGGQGLTEYGVNAQVAQ